MSAQLRAPEGASANTASPVARNLSQVIATKLLRAPGIELARLLEKDESVISRLRSGERAVNLFEFLKVLHYLGYKVVSQDKECIHRDELKMLRRTYAEVHGVGELDWDTPE
jgi:hypothetical protein